MPDTYESIINELGGEILSPSDARHPRGSGKIQGIFASIPTHALDEPELIVHLSSSFPWATPDVYLPKNHLQALRPHVSHSGLICTRAYHVFCNPAKPKEVIRQVVDEALKVIREQFFGIERRDYFIAEAQAYWQNESSQGFHFFSEELKKTFLFECIKLEKSRLSVDSPGFLFKELSQKPEIVGIRFDASIDDIEAILTDPTGWLEADSKATLRFQNALNVINMLGFRPAVLRAMLCFRITTSNGTIFLAGITKEFKTTRLFGRAKTLWTALFQERAKDLQRLTCEDLAGDRLIRRAIGKARIESSQFAAIASTRLATVGCGSLGSHIVELLLKSGIHNMYLVDHEILRPENLARHTLTSEHCYTNKAMALRHKSHRTFSDSHLDICIRDVRDPRSQTDIANWGPSLVLCAAAELSVDMLLSELSRKGTLPACWFCWVEPGLIAGHLVYQPAKSSATLADLYETVGADWLYRHRVAADGPPVTETECGCQTTFTPFSGIDAAMFAAICAHEIIKHVEHPLPSLTIYRWTPDTNALEVMP